MADGTARSMGAPPSGQTPSSAMAPDDLFRYDGYVIDPARHSVVCHYATTQHTFTERFTFECGGDWTDPAVQAAVRLLYLVAGVSYYKTTAAPVIDLGSLATSSLERSFLTDYYLNGLAEFAYRNGIDLSGVQVSGPDRSDPPSTGYVPTRVSPLIPFGGGIDSIVTVDALSHDHPDAALCVVHPAHDRFAAIEDAARVTGLPVRHVEREIDPLVRRSAELGFLNGHVPVTAIITAVAVVGAVLEGRDAVVLSNEWSASVPTLVTEGRSVNHQWSKSEEFERAFARVVQASLGERACGVLLSPAPQRALGLGAALPVWLRTTRRFVAATGPSARIQPSGSTTGAGAVRSAALSIWSSHPSWTAAICQPCSTAASPWTTRPTRNASARCSPSVTEPSRSSASATSTNPALPSSWPHDGPTDPRPPCCSDCARRSPRSRGQPQPQSRRNPIPTSPYYSSPGAPTASLTAMRQPISWSALADASVGVWGLGVEGRASDRRLRAMGVSPVLVDDTPTAPQHDGIPLLATASGGLDALARCEVVVKSPGISRYRPEVSRLEGAGVAVCGGLGLFMEEADPSRVVCITGTKGKSTTTALAVHLLTALGYRARAGGNIGHPPWDPSPHRDANAEPEPDYWIIETSSFQVPDLDHGPHVVAVTSLSPDHLDWHGTVARYYEDKLSLCTKPGVTLALAAGGDAELRAQTSLLGPHLQWVDADEVQHDTSWSASLGLPGPHNARNASMARAALRGLGIEEADDVERLAEAAAGFRGLPSRCRSLGRVGSVEFVDDSLSTNVLPTQAALEAYDGLPVALLVGGHDRGVDYSPLGTSLAARRAPTVVITMPDNGPRIGAAVRGTTAGRVEIIDAGNLEAAVETAFTWARAFDGTGAVVLLSPAAPSFGHFADFRARAAAFAEAAARCGSLT